MKSGVSPEFAVNIKNPNSSTQLIIRFSYTAYTPNASKNTSSYYLTPAFKLINTTNDTSRLQIDTPPITLELTVDGVLYEYSMGASFNRSVYGDSYNNKWGSLPGVGDLKHTATHDPDGTKTVNISFRVKCEDAGVCAYSFVYDTLMDANNYFPDITGSFSISMEAIKKDAKLLTASSFTDETNPTITYSNPAGEATTTLQAGISIDGTNMVVPYRDIPKTDTSYTFNLTDAEVNALRAAVYDTTITQATFILKSVIGSTTYTSSLAADFTIVNCDPILSIDTIRDVNSTTAALTGNDEILIRYESMASFGYSAAAQKEATIVSHYVMNGTKRIDNQFYGVFDDVESGTFTFSATDSRGITNTVSTNSTLIPYVKPTCYQEVKTELAGEVGAQIYLTITGDYYDGSFGATSNSIKIEVRHTLRNGSMSDWYEIADTPTLKNGTYQAEFILSDLSYNHAYTIQSRMSDKLNLVISEAYSARVMPLFDWATSDFNFNIPINMDGETVLRHNKEANNTVLSASGGHIYLRPGGTSDTFSETIFYPNGDVEFSGSIIANGEVIGGAIDYIVDSGEDSMGTNGTWYWTKWASGKAECYGKRNFGNMAITTTWGNLYRSAAQSQDLPYGLFADIPEVIDISFINSNYGGWIARHETTAPTESNTGSFIIVRPASATITPTYIGFNVIGRWK